MTKDGLSGFFEDFLQKESIFKEKEALQASYHPKRILHRDNEVNQIANILAPALRMEKPSNIFLYGKTGTGKTVSIQHVSKHLKKVAEQRNIPLNIIYVNCKLSRVADTEYRLIAQLLREQGRDVPPTGLPTDEIYKMFYNAIDNKEKMYIIILDEIDQLVKKTGDEVIYNLTRADSELKKSTLSIIGICNHATFADNLEPRVKSSLGQEEVVFPPYNAIQLQDILKKRADKAFKEGLIESGVIEKCAAYAAREHGDARRALGLLRVAGEITERNGENKVRIKHIDLAEEKIESDKVYDIIKTQPKQQQVVLFSIFTFPYKKHEQVYTGEVYESYKDICTKVGLRPLTQRRVSDIIAELDMLGIVNARVISKGRFGRTREISFAIPQSLVPRAVSLLEQSLGL